MALNKAQYDTVMGDLLNYMQTYKVLKGNPTKQYKKELETLVKDGKEKGFINEKEEKYIIPETCRIPVIYATPKIHKDSTNPPGCPIINGIDSLSFRLGQYIDCHLQPLVQNTKAYLKDTKRVLQTIRPLLH